MKTISRKDLLSALAVFALVLISSDLFAQNGGFNMGAASSQIKSSADTMKTWANYIIGSAFFIGCIFSTWALMTGNPQAKNFVIGTIVALVFWGVITQVVG